MGKSDHNPWRLREAQEKLLHDHRSESANPDNLLREGYHGAGRGVGRGSGVGRGRGATERTTSN